MHYSRAEDLLTSITRIFESVPKLFENNTFNEASCVSMNNLAKAYYTENVVEKMLG